MMGLCINLLKASSLVFEFYVILKSVFHFKKRTSKASISNPNYGLQTQILFNKQVTNQQVLDYLNQFQNSAQLASVTPVGFTSVVNVSLMSISRKL